MSDTIRVTALQSTNDTAVPPVLQGGDRGVNTLIPGSVNLDVPLCSGVAGSGFGLGGVQGIVFGIVMPVSPFRVHPTNHRL
jgi:hypothetical protein